MILKNKKIKKIAKALAIALAATTLTGCSLFARDDAPKGGLVIETDAKNLEQGAYYTFNGEQYGKLYSPERNFATSSSNAKGNTSNVIWIREDIDYIPTMHRGDKIVYRSKTNRVEKLAIERFFDLGYTIAVAGLTQDNTGRYSVSISEKNANISAKTSAKELFKLGESVVGVIDSIGDVPLRAGNVSAYGTIFGLEQDKTYALNVYLGTVLHVVNVKADTRIFGSAEGTEIGNYKFSGDQTVEFQFPNYFNSGYYMVNGYGLVKYLANDPSEDDANADMNVPNVYPKTKEEAEDVSQQKIQAEDLTSAKIKVESDGEQTITITYEDVGNKKLTAPSAKLITPDGAFQFEKGDGNTLTLTTALQKGEYEVQIISLKKRPYSYRVDSKNDKPTEKKTPSSSSSTSDKKSMADVVNGQ